MRILVGDREHGGQQPSSGAGPSSEDFGQESLLARDNFRLAQRSRLALVGGCPS